MVLGINTALGFLSGSGRRASKPQKPSNEILLSELEQLKSELKGELKVLHPDLSVPLPFELENKLFAQPKWQSLVNHGRPRIAIRAANKGDVVLAVAFAARHQLPITAKGTGHSYGGMYLREGAVLVDMSGLKRLSVDPATATATLQPGVRGDQLREAAMKHGLHAQAAHVPRVGMSGFTLGGGWGWGFQLHGAACDKLQWAEVVLATASGGAEVVRVDKDHHADLFWGLKGGGHFLGVVTEMCLGLAPAPPHRLPSLTAIYGLDTAAEIMAWYAGFAARVTKKVQSTAALATAPQGGALVIIVSLMGFAPASDPQLAAAFSEVEGLLPAKRYALMKDDLEYNAAMASIDQLFTMPDEHLWVRGGFMALSDLTPATAAALAEAFKSVPSPRSLVLLTQPGPRPAQPNAHDAWRDGHMFVSIYSMWSGAADTDKNVEFGRNYSKVLPLRGLYLNTIMAEDKDEVTKCFPPSTLARLRGLKAKYDPLGLMRQL